MSSVRRSTIYLREDLHRALRLRAAATEHSISDLVNDAVRQYLAEDAADLAAIRDREGEAPLRFEDFVRDLARRGRL